MPRKVALLTLLCLFVFAAGREARAARDVRAKDLKRAEVVLSKLKRLGEAAFRSEPGALRKAASKVYPGIFSSVSKLPEGDLKTDLSTAAALYDAASRDAGGGDAPDCAGELRDSYARLCGELIAAGDASRARLLAARARLHASWAEAELGYARGARDLATLEALDRVRAERSTDLSLAEEALRALQEASDEEDAGGLEEAGRILASLPRDQVYTLLRNAFDAERDALYWRLKTLPSRALTVSVNSYAAPDPLRRIDTRADDADRAALSNRRAALRFIARARESVGALKSER